MDVIFYSLFGNLCQMKVSLCLSHDLYEQNTSRGFYYFSHQITNYFEESTFIACMHAIVYSRYSSANYLPGIL